MTSVIQNGMVFSVEVNEDEDFTFFLIQAHGLSNTTHLPPKLRTFPIETC